MDQFESLVRYLFNSISPQDQPPQIEFLPQEDGSTKIQVTAAPDKVGQLIGREGKIVKALRTIINLSFPTQRYQIDFGPENSTTAETDLSSQSL